MWIYIYVCMFINVNIFVLHVLCKISKCFGLVIDTIKSTLILLSIIKFIEYFFGMTIVWDFSSWTHFFFLFLFGLCRFHYILLTFSRFLFIYLPVHSLLIAKLFPVVMLLFSTGTSSSFSYFIGKQKRILMGEG